MGAGPATPVAAPIAGPARVGLVASAVTVEDESQGRWQNGFAFDPEGCVDGQVADPCAPPTFTVPADVADVVWEPMLVVTPYRCTALVGPPRDWEARVRRRHASRVETEVSAELWTGTLSAASGWSNLFLASTDSDDLTQGGPTTALRGLQCLQQHIAEVNGGQRGFIHATHATVTAWSCSNNLRREGPIILDLFDNVIVPGAGYDGSSPDGAAASDGDVWAYATGPVLLRRSGVDVPDAAEAIAGVDRSTNTFTVFATETVAAYWDGCVHGAVRMDVPVCASGGS